jgi:hypothetical protein
MNFFIANPSGLAIVISIEGNPPTNNPKLEKLKK